MSMWRRGQSFEEVDGMGGGSPWAVVHDRSRYVTAVAGPFKDSQDHDASIMKLVAKEGRYRPCCNKGGLVVQGLKGV